MAEKTQQGQGSARKAVKNGFLATVLNKSKKMASERVAEAEEYLNKHHIMELMENMMSLLLFHRPQNPREFMSEQMELLKKSRQSGVRGPCLFANNNLDTVFKVLDAAESRHISFNQYHHALQMLGVRDINMCPEGVNEDRISHDTFRTEAMEALQRSSETFLKCANL